MKAKTLGNVICSAVLLAASLWGQTVTPSSASSQDPSNPNLEALKAQLAEQQKQIDQLKLAMADQMKLIEKASKAAPLQPGQDSLALPRNTALGDVASTTPIIPSIAPAAKPVLSGGNPHPHQPTRATAHRIRMQCRLICGLAAFV